MAAQHGLPQDLRITDLGRTMTKRCGSLIDVCTRS